VKLADPTAYSDSVMCVLRSMCTTGRITASGEKVPSEGQKWLAAQPRKVVPDKDAGESKSGESGAGGS
jgi:hypothetical protein